MKKLFREVGWLLLAVVVGGIVTGVAQELGLVRPAWMDTVWLYLSLALYIGILGLRHRKSVAAGIRSEPFKRYSIPSMLLVAVLCLLYLWPGIWRYEYLGTSHRVDRLTGHMHEWRKHGESYGGKKADESHWHSKDDCSGCSDKPSGRPYGEMRYSITEHLPKLPPKPEPKKPSPWERIGKAATTVREWWKK